MSKLNKIKGTTNVEHSIMFKARRDWTDIISALEGEAVSGGVQDPGVLLGALLARVQPQGLSRQLPRVHRAGVGQRAQLGDGWTGLSVRVLAI